MRTTLKLKWHEILLIIFFMLMYSEANSQNKSNGTFGGSGYFGFRLMNQDFSTLNAAFASNNLPQISDNILAFGGGGHGYINKLIIGGEGFSYELADKNNGTYTTQVRGDYGFFSLGYLVYNTKNLMLAPMLGIGAHTIVIDINDNTIENFNQLLSNPKKGTRLKNEQFLFDLGFKADLFLTERKFFAIGLKTGYMFAPIESEWTDVNKISIDGPSLNADGAYAQLHFTFGGFSK